MKRRVAVWALSVVVVVAACVAVWRYRAQHQPPPVTYQTTPIARRRIVGRVTATGTLLATVTVQVGTQVSGRIQKLFADYNSPVKKGQLVAKIDPLLFEAAVEQARANYQSAQASLKSAKAQADLAAKQFSREQTLLKENLAAQQDVDTAQSNAEVTLAQVDVAAASVAQTEAQLHQSMTNLSYTNIISPIDGIVISRSVDVGQTVAASLQAPVLFTIAEDLRKMQVNTNVAEGDVGRLQPGMQTLLHGRRVSRPALPGEDPPDPQRGDDGAERRHVRRRHRRRQRRPPPAPGHDRERDDHLRGREGRPRRPQRRAPVPPSARGGRDQGRRLGRIAARARRGRAVRSGRVGRGPRRGQRPTRRRCGR